MRRFMALALAMMATCAALVGTAHANDDAYIIGKIKWGMDGVMVQEIEGKADKTTKFKPSDQGEVLVYERTILDTKCHIAYKFREYQLDLNEIMYIFYPKNDIDASRIFNDLAETLSKKYTETGKNIDNELAKKLYSFMRTYSNQETDIRLVRQNKEVALMYKTIESQKKQDEQATKESEERHKKRQKELSIF